MTVTLPARSTEEGAVARLLLVEARDPSSAGNPKSSGLVAWRTSGSASPGPRFTKYQDLAGNSFYTLNS